MIASHMRYLHSQANERRSKPPKVIAVIVNFNRTSDTIECINSLQNTQYPNLEVIVVDNGSTIDCTHSLKSIGIHVIRIKRNLGFAAANNIGIRYALAKGADYIFIVNNDAVVHPNSLNELVKIMQSDPKIGICGPIIYFYHDPNRIWHAGGIFDVRLGVSFTRGFLELDRGQYRKIAELNVSGCAMLIRREVFDDVGLFDENFFLAREEDDMNIRVKNHGYKTVIVPSSKVYHKVSKTKGKHPLFAYFDMLGYLTLCKKHGGLLSILKIVFIRTLYFLRAPHTNIGYLPVLNSKLLFAYVAAILSFVTGRRYINKHVKKWMCQYNMIPTYY